MNIFKYELIKCSIMLLCMDMKLEIEKVLNEENGLYVFSWAWVKDGDVIAGGYGATEQDAYGDAYAWMTRQDKCTVRRTIN